MATITSIKSDATKIKDASVVGENTAKRVGGCITDIVDYISALNTTKVAKTDIVQRAGTAADKVMSQVAVTNALKGTGQDASAYNYGYIAIANFADGWTSGSGTSWTDYVLAALNGWLGKVEFTNVASSTVFHGRCKLNCGGRMVECYNSPIAYASNTGVQCVMGALAIGSDGKLNFNTTEYAILFRTKADGVWKAWNSLSMTASEIESRMDTEAATRQQADNDLLNRINKISSKVDIQAITVVDDLTTGGSVNALSAEQGKVLKSLITAEDGKFATLQKAIDTEAATREMEDEALAESVNTITEANYESVTVRFDGFVENVTIETMGIRDIDGVVYDTTAKSFYAYKTKKETGLLGKVSYYSAWVGQDYYDNQGTPRTDKVYIGPAQDDATVTAIYVWDTTQQDLVMVGYAGIPEAISSKVDSTEKGAASGVAPLSSKQVIPEKYIPDTFTEVVMLRGLLASAPSTSAGLQVNLPTHYYNTTDEKLYVLTLTGVKYGWTEDTISSNRLYCDVSTNTLYRFNISTGSLTGTTITMEKLGAKSLSDLTGTETLAKTDTVNAYSKIQAFKDGVEVHGELTMYDDEADVADDTARVWYNNGLFDNQTGLDISCTAAHIIDLDTDNRIATVRYTIQTDGKAIGAFINDTCVSGGIPNNIYGDVTLIVSVPYQTDGSPAFDDPYILKTL